MQEEEDRKGKEDLARIPVDHDNFDPEIMPITDHAQSSHSSSRTVEQEDHDFDIQNVV